MAAAVPIIKIVGVALSAKAAIDGIKEGNFFKAVIGAVGAYYGMSSLATSATAAGSSSVAATAQGAAQTTATAGAETAGQVAAQAAARGAAQEVAKEAVQSSALDALKVSGNQLAKRAGEGLAYNAPKVGIDAMNEVFQRGAKTVKDNVDSFGKKLFGGMADESGKGLLSRATAFGNDNPLVVQTGMNAVGGYMTAKAEEDMMEKQEKLYRESQERRGSPVDISRATGIRWNPNTRRFGQEVV